MQAHPRVQIHREPQKLSGINNHRSSEILKTN